MSEMAWSKVDNNMIENKSENVLSSEEDATFYVAAKAANGLMKSKKVW